MWPRSLRWNTRTQRQCIVLLLIFIAPILSSESCKGCHDFVFIWMWSGFFLKTSEFRFCCRSTTVWRLCRDKKSRSFTYSFLLCKSLKNIRFFFEHWAGYFIGDRRTGVRVNIFFGTWKELVMIGTKILSKLPRVYR